MGFFSSLCNSCAHPLLGPQAINGINGWMNDGVAIAPNGSILKGEYDGYGTLGKYEQAVDFENTVWHLACWEAAGSPTDYRGPADNAPDQGWFFDKGAHDMAKPG